MADLIQFRRGTAAQWTSANPTLAEGEIGLETDGAYKIGNGTTAWNSLPYRDLTGAFSGSIQLGTLSTDPGAAQEGNLRLYAKAIGGRTMLKMVGPSGLDTALQPFLGRNKVGLWVPPGNATTVPGVTGFTAYTAVTAAVARTVAVTNMFTRARRLGFPSTTTAGASAGARVAVAQITLGDGTSLGGFHKVIRFGFSDTVLQSSVRCFFGVSASTGAPTNVEPSTLVNAIGVGHGAADTNLKLFYGGSAAQTPVNLGANFPINTVNTDLYELSLFAPPKLTGVYYEVTRLNTGHVAAGYITNTNPGVTLPASTTLLTYSQNWRNNNANAALVAFDIIQDYIETDQ